MDHCPSRGFVSCGEVAQAEPDARQTLSFLKSNEPMKLKSIHHRLGGISAALLLSSIPAAYAQVSVDGIRDVSDGYTSQAVQSVTTNWGAGNALANLQVGQDGSDLAVFLGGKAAGNAIILFIDSKAGGSNFVSNNRISSGGEEYTINNLGTSGTAGLTFEPGFEPDYAVRIYCNGGGTEGHVNRYNLQTGTRDYVGQTVANTVPLPAGFISEIATLWNDAAPPYGDVINGVEMKLSLAALGVPSGAGQTVKLMAVLVNDNSSYGSNQVLPSRTSPTTDIGGGINSIDFSNETQAAGNQVLSVTVDNTDTDGDGLNNDEDTDDDGDGLLDTVETDTGTYVSSSDTGTDPLVRDCDSDGYWDGDEVNGSGLGYVSNPLIKNYTQMTVPGSFNTPNAWTADSGANTPSTDMTQGATASLTTQYSWALNYNFATLGNIEYKYAAGSWTTNWGNGGNNFAATVQATGFHTFTFNNATLAQSLTRTTFADAAAFLTAYGLSSGADTDGDNINNEAEFTANTDPNNPDTDGDGLNDDVDPSPLLASRDIVFTVNMTVQEALGNFNPATGGVVVKFFSGIMTGQPDLALTEVGDTGIYTGTLSNVAGPPATSFGNYKFFNTTAGAPNSGYEDGGDRTFNLGAANVTQTLDTVYFSNNSTVPGYSAWATTNAGGQSADQDFDGDGVENGVEYFMGQTGSSFTANPQPVAGVVSWPRDPSATGATFKVWSSPNLSNWTDVTASADTSDPNFVKYTLPTGETKTFVRLEVAVP